MNPDIGTFPNVLWRNKVAPIVNDHWSEVIKNEDFSKGDINRELENWKGKPILIIRKNKEGKVFALVCFEIACQPATALPFLGAPWTRAEERRQCFLYSYTFSPRWKECLSLDFQPKVRILADHQRAFSFLITKASETPVSQPAHAWPLISPRCSGGPGKSCRGRAKSCGQGNRSASLSMNWSTSPNSFREEN